MKSTERLLRRDWFAPARITATLARGTGSGWGADRLVAIEDLEGSRFADRLTGNGRANLLLGAAGDDVLLGLAGADFLKGEAGRDRLDGGPGRDRLDGGVGKDVCVAGEIVKRCP